MAMRQSVNLACSPVAVLGVYSLHSAAFNVHLMLQFSSVHSNVPAHLSHLQEWVGPLPGWHARSGLGWLMYCQHADIVPCNIAMAAGWMIN